MGTDRSSHTIYGHVEASVLPGGNPGEATLHCALRVRFCKNVKQNNCQFFLRSAFFVKKLDPAGLWAMAKTALLLEHVLSASGQEFKNHAE